MPIHTYTIHSSSKHNHRSVPHPPPSSSPTSDPFPDNIHHDRSRPTPLSGRSSVNCDIGLSKSTPPPNRHRSRSTTLATDFGTPETQLRGPGQRLKRELSPESDHKSEGPLTQPNTRDPRASRPRPPPVQPYFSRVGPRTTQMGLLWFSVRHRCGMWCLRS
jgi:hypothetical protein